MKALKPMDAVSQFLKLLEELEEQLDRGFFLSFIGKIVVEEKRLFSIINEMRTLAHEALKKPEPAEAQKQEAPAPAKKRSAADGEKSAALLEKLAGKLPEGEARLAQMALNEAKRVREGANEYADEVLENLERSLQELVNKLNLQLGQIEKGRESLKEQREEEVKSHGSAKI